MPELLLVRAIHWMSLVAKESSAYPLTARVANEPPLPVPARRAVVVQGPLRVTLDESFS